MGHKKDRVGAKLRASGDHNVRLNRAVDYITPRRSTPEDPYREGSEVWGGAKTAVAWSAAGCVKNEEDSSESSLSRG
jgi:hypothetical protein